MYFLAPFSMLMQFLRNTKYQQLLLCRRKSRFHVKNAISSLLETKDFFVLMTSCERRRNLRNISNGITKLPNFWEQMWETGGLRGLLSICRLSLTNILYFAPPLLVSTSRSQFLTVEVKYILR